MRRAAAAWWVFAAALATLLGVMLFFTVRVLQLERSMARAQEQAALEENVRLALWRMDSAAALLLRQGDGPLHSGPDDPPPAQPAIAQTPQRFDRAVQMQISENELQQRAALSREGENMVGRAVEWRGIAPMLLRRIEDILPGATLEPTGNGPEEASETRRLASIPARLVIPAAAAAPEAGLPWSTPLRLSLMIAWVCVLLAGAAVGRLLGATLSLSERRREFASAVTHEMRTPLTTFRMYAEMLAGGMVADEPTRRMYLATLVSESDRLGHLIENVLAYSRMESRLSARNAQVLSVEQLLAHALPSLKRRTEQAGLTLRVNTDDATRGAAVRTDPLAVQQVLINLVDNACKYGRTDIDLDARVVPGRVEISVSDRGPGAGTPGTPRLFTAFGKSTTDTVPGIGLGLYLSRRLARDLGGELEHHPTNTGARFVLTLPA